MGTGAKRELKGPIPLNFIHLRTKLRMAIRIVEERNDSQKTQNIGKVNCHNTIKIFLFLEDGDCENNPGNRRVSPHPV